MKLPNGHLAIVEREKITGYLLDPTHRFGASKARFFTAFGFETGNWTALAQALRAHARANEVSSTKETGFGPRFEMDGPLDSPDGRKPRIRTVWQLDHGALAPRLITAYPLGEP
jgi:hypothetical protein